MFSFLDLISTIVISLIIYSFLFTIYKNLFYKQFNVYHNFYWISLSIITFIIISSLVDWFLNNFAFFGSGSLIKGLLISLILFPFAFTLSKGLSEWYFRIIFIIVFITFLLIPKTTGGYDPYSTKDIFQCDCIGISFVRMGFDSYNKKCLGITYSCRKVPAYIRE